MGHASGDLAKAEPAVRAGRPDIDSAKATLTATYQEVRQATTALCKPLAVEDYVIQAMTEASPPRWHLAHVSWFFETFLLKPHLPGYRTLDPRYEYLFNSYYTAVGPQFPRAKRGLLSRPTVAEVYAYRAHVDNGMLALIQGLDEQSLAALSPGLLVGLNHERQHQELLLTDIKFHLSVNPLRPRYHDASPPLCASSPPLGWVDIEGGVVWIGQRASVPRAGWRGPDPSGSGFAFDNEAPRHQVLLRPFRLATRLTTNGEFLEFIDAGGYRRPDLWLSDGWDRVQAERWEAPLYWERIDGTWWTYTLSGMRPVDWNAPVVHVSYLEADAFARWTQRRLPTEQEWECAAAGYPVTGNFIESGLYQPAAPDASSSHALSQLFGDAWEWTQSPYTPYPGFAPLEGALGEYNGKFMVGQMVLRGGSCASPRSHVRATYRNFFTPQTRWQFSGIRLAMDA